MLGLPKIQFVLRPALETQKKKWNRVTSISWDSCGNVCPSSYISSPWELWPLAPLIKLNEECKVNFGMDPLPVHVLDMKIKTIKLTISCKTIAVNLNNQKKRQKANNWATTKQLHFIWKLQCLEVDFYLLFWKMKEQFHAHLIPMHAMIRPNIFRRLAHSHPSTKPAKSFTSNSCSSKKVVIYISHEQRRPSMSEKRKRLA